MIPEGCDGGMLEAGIPGEDSDSHTGRAASWEAGCK